MTISENYLFAGRQDLTHDQLERLARDECNRVRLRVAEHSRTSQRLLTMLSSDECPHVRVAVSEHTNVSAEILTRLIDDESEEVRYAIAENHNLSESILRRLSHDPNPYVSERASRTLRRSSAGSVDTVRAIRVAVGEAS